MEWNFYQNSKVEVTSKVFPGARADEYTSTESNDEFSFSNIAVPEGSKYRFTRQMITQAVYTL